MTDINQGLVIDNLNQYLEWHNLPLRMNRGGICNGLASIFVKYALEGRLAEFRTILKKIALLSSNSEMDSVVNHFVAEIALSFIPKEFNNELIQNKSIETLEVDGKRLKPAFEFGMVSSDANWIETLKQIDLKEDEAMIVRSINHAVSISKIQGHYIVFDPNYAEGFKFFSNEKDVVQELHCNVFHYTAPLGLLPDLLDLGTISSKLGINGYLGMGVQVIRHPSKLDTPRVFPDIPELYHKYMTHNEGAVTSNNNRLDNLSQIIELDQPYAINLLFERGLVDKSPFDSALLAIEFNSHKVLGILVDKITDEVELMVLFEAALKTGHQQAFDELLKNERCKKYYDQQIALIRYSLKYLSMAVVGGNVALVKKLMATYQSNGIPVNFTELSLSKCLMLSYSTNGNDVIELAVDSGSIECVKYLVTHLMKTNHQPDLSQWSSYLSRAIKKNHPYMVDFLIDTIKTNTSEDRQKEIFGLISMRDSSVQRTDLSILHRLKACGVHFSKISDGMIAQKEHRSVGILLSTGIMLAQFTDFIKDILLALDKVVKNYGISFFSKAKPLEIPVKVATEKIEQDMPAETAEKMDVETADPCNFVA